MNKFPYGGPRFEVPSEAGQINNPYDIDSRLLQDMQQRGIEPVYCERINLGTAGTKFLNVPGYHFVQYGDDNSATLAADTSTLVYVSVNKESLDANPFPAKSSRGFSGPFGKLFLSWPAQMNGGNARWCTFIVYKCSQQPWINGEVCT